MESLFQLASELWGQAGIGLFFLLALDLGVAGLLGSLYVWKMRKGRPPGDDNTEPEPLIQLERDDEADKRLAVKID